MASIVWLIYSVSPLQKCIKFEPHPMLVEIRECLSSNITSLCFRCCGSIPCFTVIVQREIQFSVRSEAEELTPLHELKGGSALQCNNQHMPFSFHSSPQRTTKLFLTHDSIKSVVSSAPRASKSWAARCACKILQCGTTHAMWQNWLKNE